MIKGPGILREQNQKKILSLLRKYKQTSRKDLASMMGVSKNTVSIIVDHYISAGVIREVGVNDLQKVGRPKILLELNEDAYNAIGLAIHQDGIKYIVTNYSLNVIREGFEKIDSMQAANVCNQIIRIVATLLEEYSNVLGVGIGVPGIVNSREGIVYESTNLQWKNVNIYDLLKDSISLPLIIQNSVKIASLCSNVLQEDFSNSSFFYIRIGDGIGGAFINGGDIWNGESFTSGEIGHISVDPNGPLCRCGQKGCLEKLISKKEFNEWVSNLEKDLSEVEKSVKIEEKIDKYGSYFGFSLISIFNIINPGKIVIDSPYNQYEIFQTSVKNYLKRNALKIPYSNTQIIFNEEPYSLLLGAATAVINNFETYKVINK
jgi:predicted NBD/HSP70 family sugar kinase